ncbi:hypothetical protein QFC19_006352 [Naganishia cerealis]|uniref:Uncharacterized protein n=1 Tax=Naganishia cerealis TaxID=610337 RepID=A0ACC2VGG1_9TREE|nr:hypothetical protein QFC19_006352 [Naganishia cerealis]
MTLAAGMGGEHQEPITQQMSTDHIHLPLVLDPTLHHSDPTLHHSDPTLHNEEQPLTGPPVDYMAHHYQRVLLGEESPSPGASHSSYNMPPHMQNNPGESSYGSPSLPAFPLLPTSTLSHPTLDQMTDGTTIPPPPPIEAHDLETLVARINFHGAEHGYAVRKCQSRYKEGPNGTKVCERTYLVCDKSGKHRDTHGYMNVQKGGEGRKRRTKDGAPLPAATKRIDCPFKLYARAVDGVWKWEGRCIKHNHAPAIGVESRLHRKLNPTQTVQASEWLDQGVRPHQVLLQLQELAAQRNEPCYASIKEIYNLKRLLNSYRRRGRDVDEQVVDPQLPMDVHNPQEMSHEMSHEMPPHEMTPHDLPHEMPQEMTLEQAHIGI